VTFRATGKKRNQETRDVPIPLPDQTNNVYLDKLARSARSLYIPALTQLAFHAAAQLELQTMIPGGGKTFWTFLVGSYE
jgi:hypothetical protein